MLEFVRWEDELKSCYENRRSSMGTEMEGPGFEPATSGIDIISSTN